MAAHKNKSPVSAGQVVNPIIGRGDRNKGVGLIGSALQPIDRELILQWGLNGYTVVRGGGGEYHVSNGAVSRVLPDFDALKAYAGEPGATK
jgi:hypothetical protein